MLPDPIAVAGRRRRRPARARPARRPTGPARLDAVRDALGALVRPDLRGVLVLRLDDPGAAVRRPPRRLAPRGRRRRGVGVAVGGAARASAACRCSAARRGSRRTAASRDSRERNPRRVGGARRGGRARARRPRVPRPHPPAPRPRGAGRRRPTARARSAGTASCGRRWRSASPPRPSRRRSSRCWQQACGPATTLVAPGEGWGAETLAAARARGLRLFTSWGVCRLDLPAPAWSRGIGSPYLDEVDAGWFDAGLPVVGYWHDRDMAVHGRALGARAARGLARRRRAARVGVRRPRARLPTPIEAVLVDGQVQVDACARAGRAAASPSVRR